MSAKIFGIGLNKTGTRSLAFAIRVLGFRTFHRGDVATNDFVLRAASAGKPLLTFLGDGYDAYFDVDALVYGFRTLDAQYPGSKFILTTRDLTQWLDSRERHVRANQERAARGEYVGHWLEVDRDAWAASRAAHHRAVQNYFGEDSERLLIMDLSRGDGWESLAPFLGRPVPAIDFPWENRKGSGTYRNHGVGERQMKMVRLAKTKLLTQTLRRHKG